MSNSASDAILTGPPVAGNDGEYPSDEYPSDEA